MCAGGAGAVGVVDHRGACTAGQQSDDQDQRQSNDGFLHFGIDLLKNF